MGGEFHDNVLMMLWGASPVVQVVLLVLFVFSVVSWAVIAAKLRMLRKVAAENEVFSKIYMDKFSFGEIHRKTVGLLESSMANVFQLAYKEWERFNKTAAVMAPEQKGDKRLSDNMERALAVGCSREAVKLERYLTLLASTASAAPFVGLFGTVWGIMETFRAIGFRGAATLAVVAPGISEALVATACGLLAAIPASIFYNYFLNKIRTMRLELEDFADEMLNIVERNGG